MSSAIRNPILKAARNPLRSTAAPTLPIRQLITHKPTKGFESFDASLIPHQSFRVGPDQLSTSHMAQNPPTVITTNPTSNSESESVLPTNATPDSDTIMRTLVNYQVRTDMAKAQPVAKPVKKRKRRTCAKCARPECSGSQKSSNCRNSCQDCKMTTCRGRNSSRPTKPCNTPGLWDK
jgi:hypothetical protein